MRDIADKVRLKVFKHVLIVDFANFVILRIEDHLNSDLCERSNGAEDEIGAEV